MGIATGIANKRQTLSAKEDADGVITEVSEEWIVRTAFGDEANVAIAATGLPAVNSAHPVFTGLRVASREPSRQNDGQTWLIAITYKPISLSDQGQSRLIHIEYGTHELQQDVTHNLGTGQILVDANGKPFQNTIQVSRSFPYIKIVKKQNSVDREDVITKSGTINDADIIVAGVPIPKWCGRLKIYATEQENETAFKWEISYEVLVRYFQLSNYLDFAKALQAGPDEVGWQEGIINQGFYKYVSGKTGPQRIMENIEKNDGTTEERPSATPLPLNEIGEVLAEGATPISILLQVFPSSDWSDLELNKL